VTGREIGEERFPLVQIMLGNSFLLSGLYLCVGLLVECLRRLHPSEAVVRASIALDRLPAGVLDAVGLLEPIREAYLHAHLRAGDRGGDRDVGGDADPGAPPRWPRQLRRESQYPGFRLVCATATTCTVSPRT
jgi:hypothetical protein